MLRGFLGRGTDHWSHDRELNPRPHPYHGCALPTELSWRFCSGLNLVD